MTPEWDRRGFVDPGLLVKDCQPSGVSEMGRVALTGLLNVVLAFQSQVGQIRLSPLQVFFVGVRPRRGAPS